uniref:PH domain-containing protein n=1 Tax=Setaria digitata TaxID=48799 RepID=A0A915Q5F0_9BILA
MIPVNTLHVQVASKETTLFLIRVHSCGVEVAGWMASVENAGHTRRDLKDDLLDAQLFNESIIAHDNPQQN